MVEISLETLSLCMVFSAYGAFEFGLRLSDWLTAKKWYMPIVIIALMLVGFFVIKGVYGKWFTLI